ncbi:filaggrin-like isoform X1 [Hibiscus syriacus]|uniref:Filaggrin-like isoform X1 n=1 Tax=Hibiscus syriacus TaxID=106335 RepID=A0A6A3CD22_HIBSY|nr:filaggrin-like isoform X1 [Hibiscus syriacus]
MFMLELSLKRLLVLELLSISCEISEGNQFCWSDELTLGEFGDLKLCNLYSDEAFEPVHPRFEGRKIQFANFSRQQSAGHEILQVYITTWLAEVNIDVHRVDEIFAMIGKQYQGRHTVHIQHISSCEYGITS